MQLAIFVWTLDSAMFASAVAVAMLLVVTIVITSVLIVITSVLQEIYYRLRKWWKRG